MRRENESQEEEEKEATIFGASCGRGADQVNATS